MTNYREWFTKTTNYNPHPWQQDLCEDHECRNRLIRIPTGMGKTLGVLTAWLYHRLLRRDDSWPRRLIWCLPMRVLVEQTFRESIEILENQGLLWQGDREDHTNKAGVHLLMGGEDDDPWRYYPEHPAILIGTQDMLLSRALNHTNYE